MNKTLKYIIILIMCCQSGYVLSADFPHKSAIYQRTMTAPMMEVTSEVYAQYSDNIEEYVEAEWRVQKSIMGNERTFVLTKGGYVYSLNLDTQRCTKINVKKITDQMFQGRDPKEFGEEMKRQMGLQEGGACEGAGLKGVKWTSQYMTMCMYEGVFPLWQEAMGSITRITKISFDQKIPKDKILLPADVTCEEVTPMKGMMGPGGVTDGNANGESQEMPNMEDAMKQAEEAMKKLQEMMQQKEQ